MITVIGSTKMKKKVCNHKWITFENYDVSGCIKCGKKFCGTILKGVK